MTARDVGKSDQISSHNQRSVGATFNPVGRNSEEQAQIIIRPDISSIGDDAQRGLHAWESNQGAARIGIQLPHATNFHFSLQAHVLLLACLQDCLSYLCSVRDVTVFKLSLHQEEKSTELFAFNDIDGLGFLDRLRASV
jgi:hypothetical protein